MIRFKYFSLLLFIVLEVNAQQTNSLANNDSIDIDYVNKNNIGNIVLPPLTTLFDNAKNNPSVEILEKEKQIQKLLLSKKKKNWLSYFSLRGGYSHGVTDNYGTQTDILTPIFYQYTGIEQNYWNVGGNVNIPLQDLFTIKGEIKTQKLNVEKAELQKNIAYDNLKQQIAHLYVDIQSNIKTAKLSAEYLSFYKGASTAAEEDFLQKNTSIENIANTKKYEFQANSEFEKICSTINEEIIFLEILSKTVILPH